MASPIELNRKWLQDQIKKFYEELYVNFCYVYKNYRNSQIKDAHAILLLERIYFFEKPKTINKDSEKIFVIGEELDDYLNKDGGEFAKLTRKIDPLTQTEKNAVMNKFEGLVNKITDKTEVTIKKVMTGSVNNELKTGDEWSKKELEVKRKQLASGVFNLFIGRLKQYIRSKLVYEEELKLYKDIENERREDINF